jgi:hypothetical protein
VTKPLLPVPANLALYDPRQVDDYLKLLFRHVDFEPGQVVSLLGIGEKGTTQEGRFRERKIIPPSFLAAAHDHLKRWAQWHVASFIVPAVLSGEAAKDEKATVDRVALLTAIILDIDSGDTEAKRSFATAALGRPSLIVASGGKTDAGTPKLHLYWLLNEPSDEVERVAALRKRLAAMVGGDQSFGRATQVVRIPGTVHAKHGKASQCAIVDRCDTDYSLDDLAETIEAMRPMAGVEPPKEPAPGGLMDFTPNFDTAAAALHRDVHEGGEDLTRWGEFSKVAGFQIAEVRAGRVSSIDDAYNNTFGWVLGHMVPPWPPERIHQEFAAILKVDISQKGPLPQTMLAVAQAQPAASTTLEPTPAAFPLGSTIPPRPWLLGRWLMRGKVTAMIAPGGVGKSTLTNALALSLATGRELLGKTVYGGQRKAWLWNLEDDGDSLARQRVAAVMHYGIKAADVEGRLFVDSGPDGAELCTAFEDKNSFTIVEPVMENITAAIQKHGIDCLIIDPFVSSHRVNENDNNKIDAVAKRWARVAVQTNCAIVLVHHSRKLGGEEVTADSARGAGALNNAARITLVLNRMSEEQAEAFGLPPEKHRSYINVADDKHNLTPAEAADWFELVSVDLGNATQVHEADSVGVVAPWKPPRVLDGVDMDHLFRIQNVLSKGDYFRDSQSKTWAGDVIAQVLKVDAHEAASKRRITQLLKLWIGNGTLKIEMKQNERRKMQAAVTVGRWVIEPSSATALLKENHLSEMETD